MSYLYIISEGETGPVKIGISDQPSRRLPMLQTGNPRPLAVVWCRKFSNRSGAAAAERDVHIFLGDLRTLGEWFAIDQSNAIAATEGCLA